MMFCRCAGRKKMSYQPPHWLARWSLVKVEWRALCVARLLVFNRLARWEREREEQVDDDDRWWLIPALVASPPNTHTHTCVIHLCPPPHLLLLQITSPLPWPPQSLLIKTLIVLDIRNLPFPPPTPISCHSCMHHVPNSFPIISNTVNIGELAFGSSIPQCDSWRFRSFSYYTTSRHQKYLTFIHVDLWMKCLCTVFEPEFLSPRFLLSL